MYCSACFLNIFLSVDCFCYVKVDSYCLPLWWTWHTGQQYPHGKKGKDTKLRMECQYFVSSSPLNMYQMLMVNSIGLPVGCWNNEGEVK